ncbi:hypothetical protein B566_EDAN009456 [Ephemera danica]|nr:hypothetical protein B566_EDAN009456 [Ephemera danica]
MRVAVTLVLVLVAGSLAYHLIPPEAAANHKPIRDFLVQEAKGKAGVYTILWIAETRNSTSNPLNSADMCGFMLYPDCNLRGYEWTLDLDFLGPKPTPEVPQVPPKMLSFSDPRKPEIPANLRQDWLYTLAADLWSPWLPPETRPDILAGGMYSTEVTPGLVVIGINTMFCYTYNW